MAFLTELIYFQAIQFFIDIYKKIFEEYFYFSKGNILGNSFCELLRYLTKK